MLRRYGACTSNHRAIRRRSSPSSRAAYAAIGSGFRHGSSVASTPRGALPRDDRAMKPRVRIVSLNYNGGELTSSCVAALRETEWPRDRLHVVLVDNASTDGVADAVEARWPDVTVVRSDTNRGFAGGMNLGLADLDEVDHVALVNNDVTVPPRWLAPLVDEVERDERVGAACPKILFATPFVEIEIEVPVTTTWTG